MAIPSGTASFPLGFESVTISGTAYKVDSVDIASETTRIINRPDENGDASVWFLQVASFSLGGAGFTCFDTHIKVI